LAVFYDLRPATPSDFNLVFGFSNCADSPAFKLGRPSMKAGFLPIDGRCATLDLPSQII
jgi:hypothetical protein